MMKALNCVGFWLWDALSNGATAQDLALPAAGCLADQFEARGRYLSPGDMLSRGSLTPLRPAQLGSLRAVYTGLDPVDPVSVDLEFIFGAVAPISTQ